MRHGPPPAVLAPGAQVMGYTVERQLGQGGFGTVYLARCEGQPCALKLLHVPRVGGRVEREVSILLRLEHPNVVGILGHGSWPVAKPAFAVILMEYVDGRRLDVWAEEENPSARQVARVVLDVARALAVSHEAGVLHRDVKEANVMVRASDGLAKLVDFGIGNYEGAPGLTQDILPPGTPEYRSPEAWTFLLRNKGVPGARYVSGPGDDLWALGIVFFALLTARFPFEGMTEPGCGEAFMSGVPAAPHEVNARVPRALSELCMRLLEKAPEKRIPSARDFLAALDEALRGADAAWDVALCDFHGVDTATTEGEQTTLDKWMCRPLHPPRRGRRPLPEDEAPPASATRPATPGPVSKGWRPPRAWAVLALVLWVAATVALLVRWAPRGLEAVPTRQEVAAPDKSPQAERAAAPSRPEANSAAVALPATPQEVSATVTTQTKDTLSLQVPSKSAKKGLGALARTVGTAAACVSLACPGAQVRAPLAPPPPEPCPVGAWKAMKNVGITDERLSGVISFEREEPPRYISVKEGPAQVTSEGGFKGLPDNTVLSGRLFVSDRVYGRLTWATTPQGDSFPVCMELYSAELVRGMEREPGEDDPSRARIFTMGMVRPVSKFK